ncbi:MAG TPA: FAD-dependent oxidoreductase [Caldilineaceae bacterium]|nr:FAD-dependent oxidoreductase [Caldilineaceae bacterium]
MKNYDLAIIGGGPAGLAAACYGLQAQLQVALISPTLGGKVSYPFQVRGLPAVESVWGADLAQQLGAFAEARLSNLYHQEVKQVTREADGRFRLILGNGEELDARALIVCTGAQPQRLYVPGEQEFLGCGVSFSAISHAQFFRKRPVAVVGGERALPAVLKLAAIASQVYYVLARPRSLDDSPIVAAVLSHPKVIVLQDWEVQRIVGEQFVTGLVLVGTNGEVRTIPVEGVFVEFGLLPNIEMVRGLVELDDEGRIMINQRCETSLPGLFAAGDVTNVHAEQVPVAIGEGVKAALSAWSYLAMQGYRQALPLGAAY